MDATDCYRPTEQDLDLFRQVKEYTNQHRGRFVEIAIELDQRYGSDEIRKRNARERRAVWLDKSLSRNTRAMFRRLGDDITHMIPAKRSRDADGVLQRPRMTLVRRFELAWSDTFDKPASIADMPWKQRQSEALRRVLLAWLRCDPDRRRNPWLTEFQQLVTRPTDSDLPPSYRPDYEPAMSIDALWIRRDGGLDPEAPRWITAVADAMAVLAGPPGLGPFVHAVDMIHTAINHLVALEDIPGRDICREHYTELAREKERCIAVLSEARRRVEQMRKAFGVGWIQETKEEVSRLEFALGAMSRVLRGSKAAGRTHPIPSMGGARTDVCKTWGEHEALMIRMMHFLPTLDYGEEIPHIETEEPHDLNQGAATLLEADVVSDTDEAAADKTAVVIRGMSQAQAAAKAIAIVKAEGWLGIKPLAKRVGTTPTTMRKAVKGSPHLKARRAEHEAAVDAKRKPRLAGTGGRQPDPVTEGDALSRLIAESEMEEKRDRRQAARRRDSD